jgi:hypothetical protein
MVIPSGPANSGGLLISAEAVYVDDVNWHRRTDFVSQWERD